MAVAGSLTYDTKLDTSGVKSGLNSVKNSVSNTGSIIKSIVAGLGITKMISVAMNTINDSIDGAIDRYDTLNNFPKVMKNLGVSSEDATQSIKKMGDKLTGLPTTLDAGALAVQRFTAKNGDVKKSTDIFLSLNNAILAGGASTEIQSSALEQLTQSYSKGKMDMQEWRALQTAMPGQLNQVAKAMGLETDQLGEMMRQGDNTSEVIDEFLDTIIRLNEEGSDGFASFEEQARASVGGIKTSIVVAKTQVVKGLTDIIGKLDEALKENHLPSIAEMISIIGKKSKEALDVVANLSGPLISNLKGTLVPLIGKVRDEFGFTALRVLKFKDALMEDSYSIKNTIKNLDKLLPTIITIKSAFSHTDSILNFGNAFSKTLNGMSKSFDGKMAEILSGVGSFGGLLLKALGIGTIGGLVLAGLGLIYQNFGNTINNMVNLAIIKGPSIVQNLVNGIVSQLPLLMESGTQLMMRLLDVIIANLPSILDGGVQIIVTLANGLASALPQLVPKVIDIIILLVDKLIDNLPMIIDAGINLVKGLAQGLVNAIPNLVEKVPVILEKLLMTLSSNLPKLKEAGIKLTISLGVGLVKATPQLVSKIPQIALAIVNALGNYIGEMANVGTDLLKGVWQGIKNTKNWILDKISGIGKSIVNKFKSVLKIGSPSKVMRDEIGKWIPGGVAVGIEANTDSVYKAIDDMNEQMYSEMKKAVNLSTGRFNADSVITSNLNNNNTIVLNAKFDGKVEMDGRETGRIITPYVAKTLKSGGGR